MATLEDRVAMLEAENRRLKGGAAAALALVAMALALGAAQPKPTRIKADIIEAGTILVDMVKANTVDSTKVLAGDLSLYDEMGSTSLKVTNTGDGPTLAFTNEGTRPSVQLDLPQGTPAREIAPARGAAAPSDPARAADLEAKRQRLTQLEDELERLTRATTDQRQLVESARRNYEQAQASRQDPSRLAVLQRVLQVHELSLSESEGALKSATAEVDKLRAEIR